jgi:beta-lactamase class A
MLDRRQMMGGALAAGVVFATGVRAAEPDLAAIARRSGGRLGLFALDTGSGRHIGIDADSRYAMCSTFKATLAAAVLHAVETGKLALDTPLRFTQADVLDYAPVVKKHLAQHQLTVEQACAAAVELSDNSAANLLLAQIGGPAGLTRFIRRTGDRVTRLDRTEPLLNRVAPGEVHDTTTPAAMVGLLRALLLGKVLGPDSRKRLIGWMVACETGKTKLRAGLPPDWRVGDKTGNSGDGKVNDIAICWPPKRAPILIACYLDAPRLSPAAADAIHADVGGVVARRFATA